MSHINAKRWRQVQPMLEKLGIKWDWSRNYSQPFSRGALTKHMTPHRMVYHTVLGGNTRLWWNGQPADVTMEAIAFLQMLDKTNITVLR